MDTELDVDLSKKEKLVSFIKRSVFHDGDVSVSSEEYNEYKARRSREIEDTIYNIMINPVRNGKVLSTREIEKEAIAILKLENEIAGVLPLMKKDARSAIDKMAQANSLGELYNLCQSIRMARRDGYKPILLLRDDGKLNGNRGYDISTKYIAPEERVRVCNQTGIKLNP